MRVGGNDSFEAIIQHDGSGVEIAVGLAYPFGCPDGTDNVRVPVLAGIPADEVGSDTVQLGDLPGSSIAGEKDIGGRIVQFG